MATVTRLIITSTPMSCHDLDDLNIHAEIILNGKSCKKTKAAASNVKLTTTASTATTSTNSPITSSTILEAVIVTINKTWIYVSFGLISYRSDMCCVLYSTATKTS
ncbi:uncharacterized protein LOC117321485 [Pecten maximus]|uniref:uncharacterized protein LOC117321485 n=1 Tax=Pecten maximus TaxID=6579 RepID=UPI0014580F19|nr:uncharacterized protein LOC117321485 [Pecten maximus]